MIELKICCAALLSFEECDFHAIISFDIVSVSIDTQSRARITGRVVPTALLERTMVQVPASVEILKTKADFFVELHNAEDKDVQIVQPGGMDWRTFERHWAPSCHQKKIIA